MKSPYTFSSLMEMSFNHMTKWIDEWKSVCSCFHSCFQFALRTVNEVKSFFDDLFLNHKVMLAKLIHDLASPFSSTFMQRNRFLKYQCWLRKTRWEFIGQTSQQRQESRVSLLVPSRLVWAICSRSDQWMKTQHSQCFHSQRNEVTVQTKWHSCKYWKI